MKYALALVGALAIFSTTASVALLVDRQASAPQTLVAGGSTDTTAWVGDTAKGDTRLSTSSVASVTTSASVQVVATSTSAQWTQIQNNSPFSVYLRFGADKAATANAGVLVSASSTLVLSDATANNYHGAIQAISTGGTASLLINQY